MTQEELEAARKAVQCGHVIGIETLRELANGPETGRTHQIVAACCATMLARTYHALCLCPTGGLERADEWLATILKAIQVEIEEEQGVEISFSIMRKGA